jgi:putative DNA primase/helicase
MRGGWLTQNADLTPGEQAALDALISPPTAKAALALAPGVQRWTVILNDGSELVVKAERLQRAPDDTLLALNNDPRLGYPTGARTVSVAGRWLIFIPSREAKLMAKITRSRAAPKRSQAQTALRAWQAEQDSRPGAMYGRVLQEDAEFASGKNGLLYVYERGVYVPAEEYVDARLQDLAENLWSRHLRNETLAWLLGCSPGLADGLGPDTINVRNGLLMWKGNKWRLRPHDSEVRTTMQLPVTFDPDAECSLYDRLLETSIPDASTREFLDEWDGYNLTSDCAHQKALMLGGESGSGKSQYLQVLGHLVGAGNMAAVTLQALGDNKFAAADLYGKLANICADLSSGELRMTGIFKQLTGGDVIRAEKKYKDAFEFTNAAKLSFSANEIPSTRDATSAFFDRWIVVRFPHKFRGTSAEHKNIAHQVTSNPDEMSGVLNRALRGLARLRRQGEFTTGSAMRGAQAEFRREADSVALFIADIAKPGEVLRLQRGRSLYEQFRAWCDATGHRPLTDKRLYARLRDWTPTEDISVVTSESKGYEYFTVKCRGSEG